MADEKEEKPAPLTAADMKDKTCGHEGCPNCGSLFITAVCHPSAGLKVQYLADENVLEVYCKKCDTGVARFAMARGAN